MSNAFLESAEVKEHLAALSHCGEQGARIIDRLKESDACGGVIFSISDRGCAYKAAHFYEELACRYRAGAPLGRPDRKKYRAESLAEKPANLLPEIMRSYLSGRAARKDSVVAFAGNVNDPYLSSACNAAREAGAFVVSVCGNEDSDIARASDEISRVGTSSGPLLRAVQTVFIHALCEGFEPEFPHSLDERKKIVPDALRESAALDRRMASDRSIMDSIARARDILRSRMHDGGWAYFAGNGGSAADALELCAHFGSCKFSDGSFPRAKHLLDPSYLTCAYNDGYSPFKREMEEDVGKNALVVYSTSGNSENINGAVSEAKAHGVFTIALTGKDGGKLAGLADLSIIVPSSDTGRIQEAHALIGALLLPESP